jgi:hypothetical protein
MTHRYLGDGQIGNESDKLWPRHFAAKHPHPPAVLEWLLNSLEQRIAPPKDFPDFQREAKLRAFGRESDQ